jgi:hypothetical protein
VIAFDDAGLIGVELMYIPRPVERRARAAFDAPLLGRLNALAAVGDAAILCICASEAVIESLQPLLTQVPLAVRMAIANPDRLPHPPDPDTPFTCGWDEPERWVAIATTDRWARLTYALEVGAARARAAQDGALLFAAHDAVWGEALIPLLRRTSIACQQNGLPAAVSPYTPYQHSPLPGVDAPEWAITAINAAFGRDETMRAQMEAGAYQGFWGKTGLLPFALCPVVLSGADRRVWEDDLEIDRAVRAAGFATRAIWIDDRSVYRQALPVWDEAGVRAVIDRTLHYSLHIPGQPVGRHSLLLRPLSPEAQVRRAHDPAYDAALTLSERLTHECLADAEARIARTGASWIDWGAYRHVVRVGDPFVTVWYKDRRA